MATDNEYPKYLTNVPYSEESSLNTLDICLPQPPDPTNTFPLWLIYIHGGAWRDPTITSASITKIQSHFLTSHLSSTITGIASLNYRLSPYPSHPTNPSQPSDPARNAKHPDHITDILTALLYLQDTYHFGDRYILIGHSVGATLAFQVAMKRYWGSQYESTFALELNVVPPMAIVGLEGIYDIPGLVERHTEQKVYRDFVVNAVDPKDWREASPVSGEYEESWGEGQVVVLAHSREDELVEVEQTEGMREVLEDQGFEAGPGRNGKRVRRVELTGDHDGVWRTGEAGRAIEVAMRELEPS